MVKTTTLPAVFDSVYNFEPLNVGTSADFVGRSFITPQDQLFIRSHAPIPHVDLQDYTFTIAGLVDIPLTFSLAELQQRFTSHTVVATLSCAGNRRNELDAVAPIVNEVPWKADAIGTVTWCGVRLRDVLEATGIHADAAHVAFEGLDQVEKDDQAPFNFGASIPLEKALSSETLLAYEMNGELLTPDHGFPLRVVVPGYIGARSVKWVARITLQTEPSTNYYQARAYKLFPPHVTAATANWQTAASLAEVPLNSVICCPGDTQTLRAGLTLVQGYALNGTAAPIDRVEFSLDGGRTWRRTQFSTEHMAWSWRLWKTWVNLPRAQHTLIVRAFDTAGQTQPQHLQDVWNFKGYVQNAWHRITVDVV